MTYIPQQSDLQLLLQSNRDVYAKIELLEKPSFKIVGNLDGVLTEDDYSVDADSDIRTTYNLKVFVKDSSFVIGSSNKIWLNKYIKVYIGIYSIRLKVIVYYPIGVFLFNSANYSYNATTKELSLSCVDRMTELTGERNGQVSGLSTTISDGADIREAIINAITQLGGITKYRVENISKTVPYDLEFNTGSTVYNVVKELRDLYPGWETFFDSETFICQPYPTCENDPVVLDSDTIAPLVTSEETQIDFTQIKNVIEVWGKCLDADYYTNTATFSSGTYTATYGSISGLTNGMMVGYLAPSDNTGGDYFKVDSFTSYPIICENNAAITAGRIKSGSAYVLKYVISGSSRYFYFCGEYQVCAVSILVSKEPDSTIKTADLANNPTRNISYVIEPASPFCRDLPGVGEIRQVFSGGEYENIYSEDLATERAEYELWKSTDLLDTITLEMLEIPWLTVNQKIEYTSNITGIKDTYIVKKKTGSSTGGIMTIICQRFQPLYPWTT